MRNFLALIVFILLQILFIPLAIIGFILVAYTQMGVSKKLGVSQTAIEIINGRWTMHIFGVRDDHATAKLAPVLPNTSTFGLWLVLTPLYVYTRISGQNKWYPVIAEEGEEGVGNFIINRTVYFDSIIDKAKDQAEQFVLLGAGLDTRAYNDLKNSGLKFFELDQVTNQQHKRKYLQKARIDASHIHFVEVDFSQDDWFTSLKSAGYDPNKRTIFLWEGVTLYLGEESVRNTLRNVKANAAAGSIIVADMYSRSFVNGDYVPGMKATLPLLDMTGEQLSFAIEMVDDYQGALESFVTSEELTLGETYFMGHKTEKGTFMVVAELKV
jgi:methyltransferase (TIGR00027 family)